LDIRTQLSRTTGSLDNGEKWMGKDQEFEHHVAWVTTKMNAISFVFSWPRWLSMLQVGDEQLMHG
jgi:hypothetical protein